MSTPAMELWSHEDLAYEYSTTHPYQTPPVSLDKGKRSSPAQHYWTNSSATASVKLKWNYPAQGLGRNWGFRVLCRWMYHSMKWLVWYYWNWRLLFLRRGGLGCPRCIGLRGGSRSGSLRRRSRLWLSCRRGQRGRRGAVLTGLLLLRRGRVRKSWRQVRSSWCLIAP